MKKKAKKMTAKKVVKKKTAKKRIAKAKDRPAAKPPAVMRSVNPYTEEVMHEFPMMSPTEVASIAAKARTACGRWRDAPIAQRTALLTKLAAVLRQEKRNYATLIAQEMGKPIKDAMAEVEKCAVCAEYYAANAERMLAPEMVQTEAKKSYVAFEPLGVILAIEPWNFPFWQVKRLLAESFRRAVGQYEPPILESIVGHTFLLTGGESFAVARAYGTLFWLLAGIALFGLALRMSSPTSALLALSYYLVLPFAAQASRSFQPDPLMTAAFVVGIYFLYRWMEEQTWRWAILGGLFAGFAVLVKIVIIFLVGGAYCRNIGRCLVEATGNQRKSGLWGRSWHCQQQATTYWVILDVLRSISSPGRSISSS